MLYEKLYAAKNKLSKFSCLLSSVAWTKMNLSCCLQYAPLASLLFHSPDVSAIITQKNADYFSN